MNTFLAMANNERNAGKELMVFDWVKAATIIKENCAKKASAGLRGDWEWTGGEILKDGNPVPLGETFTVLASNWAVPELEIEGEIFECFKMQHEIPNHGAKTYWPEEALSVLRSEK